MSAALAPAIAAAKERTVVLSRITGKPSLRGKRNTRPTGVSWRQLNKEVINARRRELYAENPAKHRNRASVYRKCNRDKVLDFNRTWSGEYRARLRSEMIAAYGGHCTCCAESTPQFLQLDHINNDGALDRRMERCASYVLWARLKRRGWPRDKYQLLCANCNFGKLLNGGVCPHKK